MLRLRSLFPRQTASAVCLLFGLVTLFAATAPTALAQPRLNRPAPKYLQLSPPDQKEGAEILKEMRAAGPAGDYYLEFELRMLPRRGAAWSIPAGLWGGRNREGPISRIALRLPEGEQRVLVQGGATPAAWRWRGGADSSAIEVDDSALFAPLAGTGMSVFDLQMPYLYWTDFVFEGKTRLSDRPVNTFLMYPPASLAKHRPDLYGVRVYLNPQYNAMVRAEQIGEGGKVLKTFDLGGVIKIGEHWIPRSFDLRDEQTRDKTRFLVTAAALELDFSGAVFSPGNLSGALQPPTKLTRLPQ